MREIGAFEAKNTLAALLDAVEQGEDIVITRRGKPVAKLVSPEAGFDRAKALAAVQRIKAVRQGVTLGAGITLKALIDDGRR